MSKRFEELAADIEGKKTRCPKCQSRNLTTEAGIDMGIAKLGPNWLRCLECENLFIKDAEEDG
jgi:DNA-directed RNA polymerase subunit RPC12/RpoP